MVGVPGRSGRCHTCRARKVKCDETRPTCKRCMKAGFQCLGYDRERLWRHTFSGQRAPGNSAVGPSLSRTPPPNELGLGAFQQDFCISYVLSNFIWRAFGAGWLDLAAQGRLGGLALQATTALSRVTFGRESHLAQLEKKGHALHGVCLRALAGELSKDPVTLAARAPGLMASSLVLLVHANANTDRVETVSHIKGLSGLLHLVGPKGCQRQPLLSMFEAFRGPVIVASLLMRQRLFLEHESWRTEPWALDPAAKSGHHHLLDIFVLIPGLLEDHTLLERAHQGPSAAGSSNPIPAMLDLNLGPRLPAKRSSSQSDDDPATLHEALRSRITTQLEALYIWRWQWQAANGNGVSASVPDPPDTNIEADTAASPRPSGAPTRVSFVHFEAAAEISFYNAVLTWLLALVWKLEPVRGAEIIAHCAENAMLHATGTLEDNSAERDQRPISPAIPFDPLQKPGASHGVRDLAMEICQVFEWQSKHQTSSDNKGLRPLYLFPVGMAMSVFEDDPEGQAWAQSLLQRNQVTSGYGAAYGGAKAGAPQSTGFGFYVTKQALNPTSDIAIKNYEKDLARYTDVGTE